MIPNENSALTMFEALAERRRKRPPSQRDRDIDAAVRVQGRRQVEVAAEFGLSRRRVSQICQKVEEWHAWTASWERPEEEGPQSARILQRDQLTEVYRSAMRAYARSEQPLVTRRSSRRGEQRWSDRSQRQQRLDTGSLRVALKAIEMQWQLTDRPFSEDEGKDEKARLCMVLEWVAHMLEFVRKDAETRGAVTKIPGGPKAAVEQALRVLLGVPEERSEVGNRESGVGARECEAPAEPERDWRAGDVSPPIAPPYREAPPHREADASRSPEVMGSIWEAPPEAHSSAPAVAASDDAEASYAAATAAGSGLGSAQKIEMGNASREARREGVGSLWPNTTLDHGNASPAKDGGPPGVAKLASQPTPIETRRTGGRESMAGNVPRPRQTPLPPTTPDPQPTTQPTRLERLLNSSRHLSRGHRRRLESLVAHRRGSADSG